MPSSVNIIGEFYGVQAGINYAFYENFSAEIGYRYLKSSMKDSYTASGSTSGIDYTQDITQEITTIKNWFFGVSYKF